MKKSILIGAFLSLFATVVWANCTSTTVVTPEGKIVICNVCCVQGRCTTICY